MNIFSLREILYYRAVEQSYGICHSASCTLPRHTLIEFRRLSYCVTQNELIASSELLMYLW
jgi:hypothetical protein